MNIASRVLKNFFSLSAAVIVHSAVAVVSTAYLARVLEPEGFGRLNFAFAFVQFFLILSAMGLDTIGVREVARNKDNVKHYVANIISLKFVSAICFFLILVAFIPLLDRPSETNSLLILYALALFPSAFFFEWTWQGLERMGNIGISKIMRQTLYMLLLVSFVKGSGDIYRVPEIFLGVNAIYAVSLYFLFLKSYGGVRLRFNVEEWRVLLRESLPIGITLLLGMMIYNMNTVFLSFFRNDAEVGYYTAAFQVISFILLFICVLFDALFPTISNLYNTSRDKMEKLLNLSGKVITLITVPVAVGGSMLAPRLMHLFYGDKYYEGIICLQILIWVLIIVGMNTVYARGLIASNMQNYHLKIVSLQTGTLLVLSLLLIPYLGIMGAALATLAGETMGLYFYYRGFASIGKVNIHKTIYQPLIASMAMGLFLYISSGLNLLVLIVLSVVIYSAAVYALKGITLSEMKWMMDRALGRVEIAQE